VTPTTVSIMMPAYNAEKYIAQAIDSVLAQSFQNWELLIVNDGSTDRTPEIIAGYHDPRIKTFHQANGGEASARNTALKHVHGEYLAFLDADDLYLPEHLEVSVTYLQAHLEYDGVYSDGYYIDETGERLKPLSFRRRGPFEGDIFEEMVRASDVFGAPVCVVLRSAVISKYSLLFDTDIVIGPDWDFFVRYAEVAWFGYILEPTCLYRVHQTNISIRTANQNRLLSLARCREIAIKRKRFSECTLQTQVFAFYDLLVNLLSSFPDRQAEITQWLEFKNLPTQEQARLFRLMASEALFKGEEHPRIGEWLRQSYLLNPVDLTGVVLNTTYQINPQLCRSLIKIKSSSRRKAIESSPFSNLI
jgi:glycosyltransferase involved in cell wall biosynthesis